MKKYSLSIFVILFSFTFLFASNWDDVTKIVASDRGAYDHFGFSVAISGNFAIVGACNEDHNVSGTDSLPKAGAAYIFTKNDNDIWIPHQKLVASDRAENDEFGCSVSISGTYAIVGARNQDTDANGENFSIDAGAAYIFFFNGAVWVQEQKIVTLNHKGYRFIGHSVAISGNYAIVSSEREEEDANGENSLSDAGAAYIFYHNGSSWVQQQKIVAIDRTSSDYFGNAVAISGNYAVAGALHNGTDINGENALPQAGAAYIFFFNGSNWAQQQKIVASDRATSDYYGNSVAISGDHIIVGAVSEDEDANGDSTLNNSGSAYIYERGVASWNQKQKIVALDRSEENSGYFGQSVSISGNTAIIGSFLAAYIFSRNESSWVQDDMLLDPAREKRDYFACSVAISDNYTIVGAYQHSENPWGANPLWDVGAAYIYTENTDTTKISDLQIPAKFGITNAYPNPFNPKTVISVNYAENCNSVINIYNIQGVLIKQLFNGSVEAGSYELTWDASNTPSGIYIVKMVAGSFVGSKKVVLIK
jgi:hypothetical protein